jgi:hypothetical protein
MFEGRGKGLLDDLLRTVEIAEQAHGRCEESPTLVTHQLLKPRFCKHLPKIP